MAMLLKNGLGKSFNLQQNIRISCNFVRNASTNPSKQEPTPSEENDWFNQAAEGDIDERVVPKPKSVMPDHLPQVRRRQHQKPWWKFRYFIDMESLPREPEYTEEPEYPRIHNSTKKGVQKEIRMEWYKAIQRIPTADQKIFEVTKHYGHHSFMVEPVFKQFNMLSTQQAITKTHLIHGLPEQYTSSTESVDQSLQDAILKVVEARLSSVKGRQNKFDFKKSNLSHLGFADESNTITSYGEEDILADVVQLVRNFSKNDSNVQIDYNPYVASSWWVNDFPIPFKKAKWFQDRESIDQCFLYKATHALHLRNEQPLPSVVSQNDALSMTEIPKPEFSLTRLGVPLTRHNIMSLPGFWPGASDGYDFPTLIGLSREMLRSRIARNGRDFDDSADVLDGMAIMSAFSTLSGVANNLGFSLYDRLTYPLVSQVVITDGQKWSFYVYQLNRHAFHSDVCEAASSSGGAGGAPVNLCWSSGDLKLFDSIENGKLQGVDQQVLKLLVKFVNAQPAADASQVLRPYLSEDARTEQEKAEMNYSLRRLFSNKTDQFVARRKKTNEWEKIYKNHHKAPMDPKRIRPKMDFKYPPFFT